MLVKSAPANTVNVFVVKSSVPTNLTSLATFSADSPLTVKSVTSSVPEGISTLAPLITASEAKWKLAAARPVDEPDAPSLAVAVVDPSPTVTIDEPAAPMLISPLKS